MKSITLRIQASTFVSVLWTVLISLFIASCATETAEPNGNKPFVDPGKKDESDKNRPKSEKQNSNHSKPTLNAKIADVKSGSGNFKGLVATGTLGRTELAPGDVVKGPATIVTPVGLTATLTLSNGTTALLNENSEAAIDKDIILKNGSMVFSAPFGTEGPISVGLGNTLIGFNVGRAFFQKSKTDGQVWVASGTPIEGPNGQPLSQGQSLKVDAAGTISLANNAPMPEQDDNQWAAPLSAVGLSETRPSNVDPVVTSSQPLSSNRPKEQLATMVPFSVPTVQRGIGTLSARLPGSGKKNERSLSLDNHAVNVTIQDGVAITSIEEAFTNHSKRTVEGTYRFVLPSGASITRLALDVNGRIEEGEVLEKKRAKRIFKQIVDDSVRPKDPALLEWEKGSTFSMKIFPIKGNETRRVFISYMQPAVAYNNSIKYVYPLDSKVGVAPAGRFSFNAKITSHHGIGSIRTPLYASDVHATANQAEVSFSATNYSPRSDFVITYQTRTDPGEFRLAAQTSPSGQTHAMALIRPPVLDSTAGGTGKSIVVIVDTSYGMSEDVRAAADAMALELMAGLGKNDELALLACDSSCEAGTDGFESISESALTEAAEFLRFTKPGGASNLLGAFQQAFLLLKNRADGQVIYIGDGVATTGETEPGRLISLLQKTKPTNVSVHAVGVGPDVDELLLTAMTDALGGTTYALSSGESPAQAAWRVSHFLQSPGYKNAKIIWPSGIVEAYPKQIGFIPSGKEISVTALSAYSQINGDVIFQAELPNGESIERRYPVNVSATPIQGGFIGKIWAKKKINELQLLGGAAKEIVSLSRRARVASRLTSWIVLENQRMYDAFNVQRTDGRIAENQTAVFTNSMANGEFEEEMTGDLDDLGALAMADEKIQGLNGMSDPYMMESKGAGGFESGEVHPIATRERAKASRPKLKKKQAQIASDSVFSGMDMGHDFYPSKHCYNKPYNKINIGSPAGYSDKARAKADNLEAAVRQRPLSRTAHQRYVRHLAKTGRIHEATAAADLWRQKDPLSIKAVTAFADALFKTGNKAFAMRTYGAAAEIKPLSYSLQNRLAEAYKNAGDYTAAAGHYLACINLSYKNRTRSQGAWINYMFSLAAAGQMDLLNIAAADIINTSRDKKVVAVAEALLQSRQTGILPDWPENVVGGNFSVTATVSTPGGDVDIIVVDPAGRSISSIWPKAASATAALDEMSRTLKLGSFTNGRYQIILSPAGQPGTMPISGTVSIRVKNKRKSIPFTLTGTAKEVAWVKNVKASKRVCH